MKMKEYQTPTIVEEELVLEDIIAASGEGTFGSTDGDTPVDFGNIF